jgi:hypothetical protein
MKAKKALKRLDKIETMLSDVIDRVPESKDGLGELLGSAKAAIARAKKTVNSQLGAKGTKKPAAKAGTAQRGRLTAAGRKKISVAAKRRWAAAKRKGVNPVTGRQLSKTA